MNCENDRNTSSMFVATIVFEWAHGDVYKCISSNGYSADSKSW
jgi:hypothetical protein